VDVFLDPRLPDYFREHAWSSIRGAGFGEETAFGGFLNQRMGIIHGYDLSAIDLDFLGRLSFPQTWEFKKLQVADILAPRGQAAAELILRDAFGGDRGAYDHFAGQVLHLKRICDDLLGAILPVKPEAVNVLTRFSETRMENLHYDLDKSSDDHEAFRLYINLDNAPRIWATSYQMTELIRQGGQRLSQGVEADWPCETILKRIATRAYGGWNQRATERVSPRHLVYVDPGDIFCVDGRSVSHQVMSGHRVLTIYARIPHGSLPSIRPTFAEKIRSALADARKVPHGHETALVNYYEPGQLTAASNVREEWGTIFGQTQTGRIRRFNDFGMTASNLKCNTPPRVRCTDANQYDIPTTSA
jgi:hypothetical protein